MISGYGKKIILVTGGSSFLNSENCEKLLRGLDAKDIRAPWEKGIKVAGYPERPIVDRALVKERTLKAYNISKGNRS